MSPARFQIMLRHELDLELTLLQALEVRNPGSRCNVEDIDKSSRWIEPEVYTHASLQIMA